MAAPLSRWISSRRRGFAMALIVEADHLPVNLPGARESFTMARVRRPVLPKVHARRRFQRRLLGWYAVHRRDLPWRRTTDPYRVLVSEIMLQQTQVDRVVPKYHEFLARYPTLETLAGARPD